MRRLVYMFTDGSTYPSNPGNGGSGIVLVEPLTHKVLTYGKPLLNGVSTNNYAESSAVRVGLSLLKEECHVKLYTDSQYVIYGINRILKKKNLLKTNTSMWNTIQKILKSRGHTLELEKVQAHSASQDSISMLNKLSDKLASYSARTGKVWVEYYDNPEDAYSARPTKSTE